MARSVFILILKEEEMLMMKEKVSHLLNNNIEIRMVHKIELLQFRHQKVEELEQQLKIQWNQEARIINKEMVQIFQNSLKIQESESE